MKFQNVINRLAVAIRQVARTDVLDLLPLLTVLLLLLSPLSTWYLHTPLVLLCIIAVAYRKLLKATPFWYIISVLWGTTIYFHWESTDNHKYLICYWCLALCTTFSVAPKDQLKALRQTSRLLIGLCMTLATLWKLMSPDYLDGTFFHYCLLIDERFTSVATTFGNVSSTTLTDNRELWELLREGYLYGIEFQNTTLETSPELGTLARFLSWWTIFIEAALAWLFFMPAHPLVSRIRNFVLLVFAVTTYAVAPVKGFGWILMLLGVAQCHNDEKAFRIAYLVTFLLIQCYTLPFAGIVKLLIER